MWFLFYLSKISTLGAIKYLCVCVCFFFLFPFYSGPSIHFSYGTIFFYCSFMLVFNCPILHLPPPPRGQRTPRGTLSWCIPLSHVFLRAQGFPSAQLQAVHTTVMSSLRGLFLSFPFIQKEFLQFVLLNKVLKCPILSML